MITLVDYGLGNILAFANLYKRLNIEVSVAKRAADLASATRIILPGVGAFDHAMTQLEQTGMRPALDELVLDRGVPVLGICVGMQMLARSSEEGVLPGLGWIPGRVKAFRGVLGRRVALPHMGWNEVSPRAGAELFRGLEAECRFYFLHSFYMACEQEADVAATCDYGLPFHAAVAHRNIHGVQFHPEKSHRFGIQLLKSFAEIQHA